MGQGGWLECKIFFIKFIHTGIYIIEFLKSFGFLSTNPEIGHPQAGLIKLKIKQVRLILNI